VATAIYVKGSDPEKPIVVVESYDVVKAKLDAVRRTASLALVHGDDVEFYVELTFRRRLNEQGMTADERLSFDPFEIAYYGELMQPFDGNISDVATSEQMLKPAAVEAEFYDTRTDPIP
jgi:hypothetical protein